MVKLTQFFGGRAKSAVGRANAAESALTLLITALANELVVAKNHLALAQKEENLLAKQAEVAARAAEHWRQRAMSAVRAGDDFVSKDALVRRREHDRTAGEFRAARDKQRDEIERLKAELSDQSYRVEEAKHKKNAVLLRAKRMRVEDWLATVVKAAGREAPLELLDRVDAKLLALEEDALLSNELSERSIASSSRRVGDEHRAEADLLHLKRLEEGSERAAKKPLAKTGGGKSDADGRRARSGASRERRAKR
jgi:phage shock protein A